MNLCIKKESLETYSKDKSVFTIQNRSLNEKSMVIKINLKIYFFKTRCLFHPYIKQWTVQILQSGSSCIKHFHWMLRLFWPIRFDVIIVSIGNNCNVKSDWPESLLGTVVKSNLIGQNHLVNQENPLYNWVQGEW